MNRCLWLALLGVVAWLATVPAAAQFTEEQLARREKIEEFLANAEIVESEQMDKSEGVTRPWNMRLRGAGLEAQAIWKNPSGRMGGFWECWKCEIAAYRMDKYLGVNMVPPVVERRFQGAAGAIVFFVEHWISGREKLDQNISVPGRHLANWNRMTYLQRAFDNLIGNEDRHLGNILITEDWRLCLIDHSRSFRTTKAFTKKLPYDAKKPMKSLPRAFVEKVKALDEPTLRGIVGDYLRDKEVEAVLARRELLLKEMEDQGTRLYD